MGSIEAVGSPAQSHYEHDIHLSMAILYRSAPHKSTPSNTPENIVEEP